VHLSTANRCNLLTPCGIATWHSLAKSWQELPKALYSLIGTNTSRPLSAARLDHVLLCTRWQHAITPLCTLCVTQHQASASPCANHAAATHCCRAGQHIPPSTAVPPNILHDTGSHTTVKVWVTLCHTVGHTLCLDCQCIQAQRHLVAAMPAVSTVRGLVLTTLRTPPKPQGAPTDRPVLVQQSPTKAAIQVDRDDGADCPEPRH
jgi:hypothetical protein